jgi:hypothetical protein
VLKRLVNNEADGAIHPPPPTERQATLPADGWVDFIIVRDYSWAFPRGLDSTEGGARRAEVWCCAKCGAARASGGVRNKRDGSCIPSRLDRSVNGRTG